MKLNLRLISTCIILGIIILDCFFVFASPSLFQTSKPAPTGYTLTNIYNLIHSNITTTSGNHGLAPSVVAGSPSSYSVSQLYADLANLVHKGDVATGTDYLGITGDYGNYTGTSSIMVISSTLTPQGSAGDVWGYSLEDVYQLAKNNITTTAGSHPSEPDGAPANSMHSLTDIYEALISLGQDKAPYVKLGKVYLGATGSYNPIILTHTITFDINGANMGSAPDGLIVAEGDTINLYPYRRMGFARENYHFIGWSTTSNGGVEYADGASYTMGTSDVILYAVWEENIICTDYTYSDWEECMDGIQYRSVISATPEGCYGDPLTSQSCGGP
jgi:hypothetical protein